MLKTYLTFAILYSLLLPISYARAQSDWDKTVEAAKKEGKVVAGIPASATLRKALDETFSKRFPAIDIELAAGRGPANASKIAAEHAAGVRYFDVLISGSLTRPASLFHCRADHRGRQDQLFTQRGSQQI